MVSQTIVSWGPSVLEIPCIFVVLSLSNYGKKELVSNLAKNYPANMNSEYEVFSIFKYITNTFL